MSATDCKSECVFWKLVEERAPRAWGGVGWVAALTLLGKGQQSEQWAGRGGVPRLRWRHYRPKGLRMKTTGHWERVETGRAAFPFPPALQSCPSPLLPLSPATCLPPPLPSSGRARQREANGESRLGPHYCVARSQTERAHAKPFLRLRSATPPDSQPAFPWAEKASALLCSLK